MMKVQHLLPSQKLIEESVMCSLLMVLTPKKKKDWLNTSVNKESHHGLLYRKDCDISQIGYWIIEYWIQKAQSLGLGWSAKSSNSCDPGYEVMEELWFFPCLQDTVVNTSVCRSFYVMLRAVISQKSKNKSKFAGLPPQRKILT